MADTHDNRAAVTVGGRRIGLVASKDAKIIYASRFAHDVGALGESEAYLERRATAEERAALGTDTVRERVPYVGHLKRDLRTTMAGYPYHEYEELPVQAVAMVWAMARADEGGGTDQPWDEFLAWWLSQPCSTLEDYGVWEELCGLAVRAFFRDRRGQGHARQPDQEGAEAR